MNLTIWLDVELGLFHIVQQNRNQYQVRAHRLEGIQEIRALARVDAEIIETPDSTFRYVLNLAPGQLVELMARLTQVDGAALSAPAAVSAPLIAPLPMPPQTQTLAPAARARLVAPTPYASPVPAHA